MTRRRECLLPNRQGAADASSDKEGGLDLEKGPERQDQLGELVTEVEHRDEDRQQDHGDDGEVLDRLLGVDTVISASCTHVREIRCLGRRSYVPSSRPFPAETVSGEERLDGYARRQSRGK